MIDLLMKTLTVKDRIPNDKTKTEKSEQFRCKLSVFTKKRRRERIISIIILVRYQHGGNRFMVLAIPAIPACPIFPAIFAGMVQAFFIIGTKNIFIPLHVQWIG
jgi:hypothetical protein